MLSSVTTPAENMTLERLKSLYEFISRMNSVQALPELLAFVIDRALSLTGGRRGVLLLTGVDEPAQLREIAVMRGDKLEQADLERLRHFVSTTVIQDVIDRAEPRLVTDLRADARYEMVASYDTINLKRIRSVLAVPLKAESRLVGLIYIDHPNRAIFDPADLEFISAFAGQAALAIDRARQHQRQIERLQQLNELSRSVVQALDLNEVLTRIVAEVTKMLKVEASSVLLLDDQDQELYFATSVSHGRRLEIPTRLKKGQGLAGWVVSHGQPLCINDVSQDERWFSEEVEPDFESRSILSVPLQLDRRVVGVLQAVNKNSFQGFEESDITLLAAFAAYATIAIENAKLFQEASRAHQLRAINEVAIKLSSTLDLNTAIDEGLDQTLQVLKADAGLVCLFKAAVQSDLLTVQLRGHIPPAHAPQQVKALAGLTAWFLNQDLDHTLGHDVVFIHPGSADSAEAGALAKTGIEALILAPILIDEAVSGAIAVISLTPQRYTLEDTSLLSSIARIIGLAAQNAIHHRHRRAQTRHLAYLNAIGSALTRSLNVDHVLEVIIEGVNTLLQTELTSVFLIEPTTNELVLRYSTKNDAAIRLEYPWQGIAGWVARHDEPALVNNTHQDSRYLREIAQETGFEVNSILCVPLKVEGQVIGVVEVLNKTGGQSFTPYHQSLLVELTKWAAIALHNARLFDERGQAYRVLEAEQQRRIAAETRGAVAAIILDMAHKMNNVVGAIRVWATSLEHTAGQTPQAPVARFERVVSQIRQNAEEAIKLMSTMTGPLQQVELKPVEVQRCLEAAARTCWWPDNIKLTKHLAPDLPLVTANDERLEAVFYNLLANAVQALTGAGGAIRLITEPTLDGWVQILIADNGPGLPPDLLPHVFNPGVSGRDGGLGIGLWLVETFVQQFGGQVSVESQPGRGATFKVTLRPWPGTVDG
jgi:GAF domain-containing protein